MSPSIASPTAPSRSNYRRCPATGGADSAWATHLGNAVSLLFPSGERFFIRSVRHFEDRITDPALRAAVRGFYEQEGAHSRNHELQMRLLESQGYDVRRILDVYERLAWHQLAPRFSPAMRLSVTVALEHYTAIMAENVFQHGVLELAHPAMRQLLLWHAAEEIEHKAVAFDVLRQVAPGYARRMAGMFLATLGLFGFWLLAFVMLKRQERRLTGVRAKRPKRPGHLEDRSILRYVVLPGLRRYARRDFHPDDDDTLPLAREYLAHAALPTRGDARPVVT